MSNRSPQSFDSEKQKRGTRRRQYFVLAGSIAGLVLSCGGTKQTQKVDESGDFNVAAAQEAIAPPSIAELTPQIGGQAGQEGGAPSLCDPGTHPLAEKTELGPTGHELIDSTPKSSETPIQWPSGDRTSLSVERLDDRTHETYFTCGETVVTVVTYALRTEDGLLDELATGQLRLTAEGIGQFKWGESDNLLFGALEVRDFFPEARCTPLQEGETTAPPTGEEVVPPGAHGPDCKTGTLSVNLEHSPSATTGMITLAPMWQVEELELATWQQ